MANYSVLKAAVQSVVKTNGNGEITGANMQTTLLTIIDALGAGYQFMGVATPATIPPSSPDYNMAYIGGAGSYSNFGTSVVVLPTNIAIFTYNGSWTCTQVTVEHGDVFDISAFNSVGGTLATYADLAAALGTGGVNVPEGVRKGGMSIKFVQNIDNKYVQYRLMADEWSTMENDWQGMDDKPTLGSNNLVRSGGVYNFKDIFVQLSKSNGIDLCLVDKHRNCLIYFKDGHIKTKNFDSQKAPIYNSSDISGFAIEDGSNNTVIIIRKDGRLITKGFDSKDILDRLDFLTKEISQDWSGKNICILGDSLTDLGWYSSALEEELGCTVYNRGWSGSLVTPTVARGTAANSQAYAFVHRFDTDIFPENDTINGKHLGVPSADIIDLMIIFGGTNDWGHGNEERPYSPGGTNRTRIAVGNITDAMSDVLVNPNSEDVGASFYAALKYTCY